MEIKKFQTTLADVKEKVLAASNMGVDLKKVISSGQYIYDYKMNKAKFMTDRIKRSSNELVAIMEQASKRNKNERFDDIFAKLLVNSKFLVEQYLEPAKTLPIIEQIERDLGEVSRIEELEKEIRDFEKEAAAVPVPKLKGGDGSSAALDFSLPELPEEIGENIEADVNELKMCYDSGCYRSATILCGRIIETALHRKYFEVTGKDALEKEPGIGIGKLIARMSEKGIRLDPGLPQMVHLINQVRIFSVHTKQQAFNPSKNQAHATILYTMDVLGRLFSSE